MSDDTPNEESEPDPVEYKTSQTFLHDEDNRIRGKVTVELEGFGDVTIADLREVGQSIIDKAREEYTFNNFPFSSE